MLCKFKSLRESVTWVFEDSTSNNTFGRLNMWLILSKCLLEYYLAPFSQQMQELSHLGGWSLSGACAHCLSCSLNADCTLGRLRRFPSMQIPGLHPWRFWFHWSGVSLIWRGTLPYSLQPQLEFLQVPRWWQWLCSLGSEPPFSLGLKVPPLTHEGLSALEGRAGLETAGFHF